MGGMCARVCPTETLCEEACVREAAEGKPVAIGLLQRYATDALIESGQVALQARRADRQAGRDRRRRPGGPRLRARARRRRRRVRRSSRRAPSPAASTNTASPPTRRSTISPPGRPTSSCRSAASRCSYGVVLGRDVEARGPAPRLRRRLPRRSASGRPTSSACRARTSSRTSSTRSTTSRRCGRRAT